MVAELKTKAVQDGRMQLGWIAFAVAFKCVASKLLTRLLANFRALLSRDIFNNSINLLS